MIIVLPLLRIRQDIVRFHNLLELVSASWVLVGMVLQRSLVVRLPNLSRSGRARYTKKLVQLAVLGGSAVGSVACVAGSSAFRSAAEWGRRPWALVIAVTIGLVFAAFVITISAVVDIM